ncbi:inositol monophosphatase family protein [Roseococcus thiosulfatophilus]|uniref:inositol monophosphatase family protein n=1 Tax=Roseococcus thiosulfatophilus TaxID=35813 RepID=UPI001A906F69|nr:inositol monophosphatase family protein [Roseococcus thiosulfatophilus]
MAEATDLRILLPAVVAAAEAAGRLLAAEFARPGGPRGAGSHADIDREIEVGLRDELLELLPARWLGEETGADLGPGGADCWVVDPNDGTSAFLAGHRGSAVCIALLRGGVPALGVVHAPLSPDRGPDTIAWAEGMDHLLRNGHPVAPQLAQGALNPGSIVFLSHSAPVWPIGNGRAVAPARFVGLPSIAYRLARVAAGDGVAAVSLNGPCGWDYAAGHALLRGAGGVLLNEAGAEVRYTIDGHSSVRWCFGGAPAAARALAARDWGAVRRGQPLPRRVTLVWPRLDEGLALDRAVGCLLGQVAGDSLGSLVEFRSAGDIARQYPDGVHDLADGGTWNTIAGQPTDDSELALDLARTLAVLSDWSAEAVAGAYADWLASRPFDVGGTTRQALAAAVRATTDTAVAARAAANRESKSNGALMRCAPIGVWARDPMEAAAAARADAELTHPHPACQAASASFAAAIAAAIGGADRSEMMAAAEAALVGSAEADLREALDRARGGEGPRDFIRQQGWVLIAWQNAFRHLAAGTPLQVALSETVARGGDTDTNAAICGALLGAAAGRRAIPSRWTLPILACRPARELRAPQPRPARYWPDDLPAIAEALVKRRMLLQ